MDRKKPRKNKTRSNDPNAPLSDVLSSPSSAKEDPQKVRDDFSSDIKSVLARRVGMLCSNPGHRVPTSGPQEDSKKATNIGVAAHITAAAAGGPRFDETLPPDQRKSIENAIWLCQNCAKLIDNDPHLYTVDLVRR